jgi:hypothetical protein
MYEYNLYAVEDGFGFIITNDGSPCIQQDYMPDVDGFVVMTEEEAKYWAEIIIQRLQ